MPFKTPLNSALTESQNKALSKLSSVRTYTSAPKNLFPTLVEEQQISTFDLSIKYLDALAGPGTSDGVLRLFLGKVFAHTGPDKTVLEDMIIKGLADSLDARDIHLAPQKITGSTASTSGTTSANTINSGAETTLQNNSSNFEQFDFLEYKFISESSEVTGATESLSSTTTESEFVYNNKDITIKIINNSQGKLPEFSKIYPASETLMTLTEILESLQNEANNSGFGTQNLIIYPKNETPIQDIPFLTGNISGTVYNGVNNEVVSGVKLEIVGSEPLLELVTDISGSFKINNLKTGKYNIKASNDSAGFEPKTIEGFEVNGGTDNVLQISIFISGQTATTVNNSIVSTAYNYDFLAGSVDYMFLESVSLNYSGGAESLILTIENDVALPSFDITIPASETITTEDDLYAQSLVYKNNIINNGFLKENTQYPAKSNENLFSVSNNVDLPVYVISGITIEELESSFLEERTIEGNKYPAEGALYGPSSLIDSSGNTVSGQSLQPIPNTTNIYQNVPSGNIDASTSSSSGSTGSTLQFNESGEFTGVFNAKFNPQDVGLSNEVYLRKYLLPALTAGKRLLVKQIITMIFGPKELMSTNPDIQNKLIQSASCGEQMFSVSNNPSITGKDLEYNKVKLREQLQNGKIELKISCQKIEIKLPENFIEEFDLQSSEEIGISEDQRPNPANSFFLLENFVQNEVQRQRNEEDSNSAKKTFFEIIIDKIMQYISIAFAVSPEIEEVFSFLNAELRKGGQEELNPKELLSSPCEIVNACQSGNKEEFKKKSAFSSSLLNSLYSLVLSMLIRKLITEAKVQIKKLLQEKAREKIEKIRKKQQNRFKNLENIKSATDKVSKFKSAFSDSGIEGIFKFLKKNEENNSDSNTTI